MIILYLDRYIVLHSCLPLVFLVPKWPYYRSILEFRNYCCFFWLFLWLLYTGLDLISSFCDNLPSFWGRKTSIFWLNASSRNQCLPSCLKYVLCPESGLCFLTFCNFRIKPCLVLIAPEMDQKIEHFVESTLPSNQGPTTYYFFKNEAVLFC